MDTIELVGIAVRFAGILLIAVAVLEYRRRLRDE